MFNFILFGPPGSGKGTQSIKIAEKYNLAHISTGDIFRKNIREKTELGIKVQSIIEKGELVPDELLIDILDDAMNKYKNVKGFVF
ncbi:MAG: nucleoside monophosphate kinase, partial [Bacteroidales bacterium]|nr:nucleoside monophosphate kinase [Bacteroidales bacterium]